MIQKLGKYSIVEKLGEGAMGAVYKAYDEVLDRYVAIKTMAEDIKWDQELKLRFYREARSAASLHHPNIVTIHDLGEEGKITYIVMELLQGKDLKDLIKERAALPIEKKISIIAQVCDGLNHAHMAGIIHRDIKPGNIHFSTTGTVKIVDFGIARIPSSDLTRSGVRLGTPIYMSPEQIKGANCDERSDMFSTGLVFYELLTYVHPFRDKNIAKTVDNILFQNHFAFAEQCPDAPPGLWPILQTALAKDAKQRYPSMAEMGRACRGLLAEMNVAAQRLADQLNRTLPVLRQAAARPDAPANPAALLQQTQTLLAQPETPDLASLRRMADAVAEYSQQPPAPPEAAAPPPPQAAPPPPPPNPRLLRGIELLRTGQALLREDKLDEASQALFQSVELLGRNEEALAALAEANRKIAGRNNARCPALLEEARRSMESKQYPAAIDSLNQILQMIPDHPEAGELRRRAIAEAENERNYAMRKQEGELKKTGGLALLHEGKYRESAAALARAAELLGEDAEIRAALEEATRQIREEDLRLAVETGLKQAAEALSAGTPDQARAHVENVLKLAPENADAAGLLSRIDRAEEEQVKARAFADLIFRSRNHLRYGEFDRASEILEQARGLDPANPDVEKVTKAISNARAEKEKRDRLEGALTRSREALARADFDAAAAACTEALAIDPAHGAGRSLLDSIRAAQEQKRRGEQISRLTTEAEQAYARGELDHAEKLGREALILDPESRKIGDFLAQIRDTREKQQREEIDSLLARCRQTMDQGNFEEAARLAEAVGTMDPQNNVAAALAKDIKKRMRDHEKALAREAKQQEKEIRRREKEARRPQPGKPAAEDAEGTLILEKAPRKGISKVLLWVGAAVILLGMIGVAIWQIPKLRRPRGPEAQLTAAQNLLDKGLPDDAIRAAQQVLDAFPENAQAAALIDNARKQKTAKEAAMLLMEAQALRSAGKLQESLDAILKLLSLDPANEPALAVRSQIEGEMTASKSAADQEAAVKGWLANADGLIAAGRLAEAKAELDKAARVRPGHPDLAPLRKKLAARTEAVAQVAQVVKEKSDQTQKQKQIEGLTAQAEALFRQGKYAEAQTAIDQWIALAPQSLVAQSLQQQNSQALQHVRAYDTALAAKSYDEALKALAQLEKINPADPALAEWRRRAEGSKASARAVISIYRIGAPGVIAIDEETVGSEAELENRPVPIGRHRISVTIAGKQIFRTSDLQEGQREAYVYDSSTMELRPMVEADRALIARRKTLEQVSRYDVEHRHMLGKCTGILSISGLRVAYQGSEKSHSFEKPLADLKITVKDKDDKVDIQTADGKQSWTFKVRDAAQAAEIRDLCARLLKLLK